MSMEIHKKPTTDCTIPSDSCHPNKHKTVVLRYISKILQIYCLRNVEKSVMEVRATTQPIQ